jgi:ATP-dependent RNA helicase DDX19/DBP5
MQSMLTMGAKCLKLSGDMQPEARDEAVLAFRKVHAKILIATDVIARGFDVSTVTLVVNYDLPVDIHTGGPAFDTYLHRIGRSGRFGRKGAAFNFVNTEHRTSSRTMPDLAVIEEISRYFKREIPSIPADDEEAFIRVLEDAGLAEQEDA